MDTTISETIMKTYSYAALGDSYTIGEQVRIYESFPYQAVQLLRNRGLALYAPEIVAVTGFTTDELHALISDTHLLHRYDFVSLLIGVNNQYRGRSAGDFKDEFEALLNTAIQLAGNSPGNVTVLSIPDWGVTPFAAGRNRPQIAGEIDAYNAVCRQVSNAYQTHFIDITVSQRMDGDQDDFLAPDKLHPSGKEYAKWAALLSEKIISVIQ
jgi:lysophospholipase L1-like esterase